MNQQIIKEYTIKQVEDLMKDYMLVKIEDLNGKKIIPFNNPKKDIKTHWKDCIKRFNSQIIPDGYYYFCFSQSIRSCNEPDKFLVAKGNPGTSAAVPIQNPLANQPQQNAKDQLLTVTAALDYITQIANLKNDVTRLELEVQRLKDENAVLNAELEELDREGLSENKQSGVAEYLKETGPSILSALDRFFELQEKRINLDEKKLDRGVYDKKSEPDKKVQRRIKSIETGSEAHIAYIKKLYADQNGEQLDKELDKLEAANPEVYEQICQELNLFE
jgi:hypothetical protein